MCLTPYDLHGKKWKEFTLCPLFPVFFEQNYFYLFVFLYFPPFIPVALLEGKAGLLKKDWATTRYFGFSGIFVRKTYKEDLVIKHKETTTTLHYIHGCIGETMAVQRGKEIKEYVMSCLNLVLFLGDSVRISVGSLVSSILLHTAGRALCCGSGLRFHQVWVNEQLSKENGVWNVDAKGNLETEPVAVWAFCWIVYTKKINNIQKSYTRIFLY